MDNHNGNGARRVPFSAIIRSLFISYEEFVLIHPTIRLHDFAFIAVLLNLVLLKFQGTNTTTPFHTHPNTVNAAAISFLLLVQSTRLLQAAAAPPNASFLAHFVFLFWSLCVASLVSLLLPDAIRPFLYVLSVVPFVVALLRRVCPIILGVFWDLQRIMFLRHLLSQLYRNQMQHPRLPI